jgi:hypothetical protein
MHKTENPGGWGWGEVAQNPWGKGVNPFWAKSQRGYEFWVLLHFYFIFNLKFAWGSDLSTPLCASVIVAMIFKT